MSSCTWGDKTSFISVQYAGDKVLMFSGQGLNRQRHLKRYQGTWYELARLPMYFQRNCAQSEARYTLLPDGDMSVFNRCLTTEWKWEEAKGTATPQVPGKTDKLWVEFNNWFTALLPASPRATTGAVCAIAVLFTGVVPIAHHPLPIDQHIPHLPISACEQPAIENPVLRCRRQVRIITVQHNPIRSLTHFQSTNRLPQRLGTTVQRGIKQRAADHRLITAIQPVTPLIAQALAVFHPTQLFHHASVIHGCRTPMPMRPPWARKSTAGKIPSPRLASVIGHRPAIARLLAMRATSSASAWVACTRHQRASTGAWSYSHCTGRWPLQARQASTSFLLFGDVDMHRARFVAGGQHCIDLFGRHRTQRVETKPQLLRRLCGEDGFQLRLQVQVVFGAVDKPSLAFIWRLAAKPGVGVKHWHQCQANPAAGCRLADLPRQLRTIGIRLAADVMVHIVEFGHRRVAGLEHFDVQLACDHLQLIRVDLATMRYIRSRQVQKLSFGLPATSAKPAMARWNAWEAGSACPPTQGLSAVLHRLPWHCLYFDQQAIGADFKTYIIGPSIRQHAHVCLLGKLRQSMHLFPLQGFPVPTPPAKSSLAAHMDESPAPLYARVKQMISQQILNGNWPPHYRVPSESELVSQLGFSRMTINRALRELTAEGLLVRMQVHNIADEIASRGHRHTCQVIHLGEEAAGSERAVALEMREGGRVFHSLIVHFENDIPVQIEDRFVNALVAPEYLQQDFTQQTPYAYLNQVAPLTEGEHVVRSHPRRRGRVQAAADRTHRTVPVDSPTHLVGPPAGDRRAFDPPRFPSQPGRTFQ
ncbi:lipocalin-like domain-containing protein [Ditylenchus destructor]|nr:lipocalin-like domain-containing protein [Ditylenchus destructor]